MKGRLKNVQTTFFMSLLSIIGRAELLTLVCIGGITRQAHSRRVAVVRLRSRFFVHQNLAVFPNLHGYAFTVFQLPFQYLRIGILTLVDRTAAFSRDITIFINHALLLTVGTGRIGSNGKTGNQRGKQNRFHGLDSLDGDDGFVIFGTIRLFVCVYYKMCLRHLNSGR
ncbi:hypothetical protein NEIMUCOT_05713 [Neisseria mucosa ATCC 25996]|uniref:Uncharacterized protein n=1 Tax=Neisseria mucosa (strain ATCC 25996 / DSM 4631 / NCTC 10774 / M26) TaxID=546266 RepID=D2ZYK2_NEIM2|nr:hypothetical protein NEIMUCOT_05713 [Neisseria mucosa ATCC 25996]